MAGCKYYCAALSNTCTAQPGNNICSASASVMKTHPLRHRVCIHTFHLQTMFSLSSYILMKPFRDILTSIAPTSIMMHSKTDLDGFFSVPSNSATEQISGYLAGYLLCLGYLLYILPMSALAPPSDNLSASIRGCHRRKRSRET